MCIVPLFENVILVPANGTAAIFGFTDFVTALALLFIVFNLTDPKIKFRIFTAPIPIQSITKWATVIIGVGTLLTDTWFQKNWLIPSFLSDQATWQATFGSIFLVTIFLWLYFAYLRLPVFSKLNYRKYSDAAFNIVLKGSEQELPVFAHELASSAHNIIKIYSENPDSKIKSMAQSYSHDLLLLIGNRKLCRYIVSSSPITAIAIFEEIAKYPNIRFPIQQFAQNLTREAINNKDSNLYHEDELYISGLMGYLKPFTKTIYGNFKLIQNYSGYHESPLDVDYSDVISWDAKQLKVYTRLVLAYCESYFNDIRFNSRYVESSVFVRVLNNIGHACGDIYKLDDRQDDAYADDSIERIRIAVDFVRELVCLLDKAPMPKAKIRRRAESKYRNENLYDFIADLMFEIILSVSGLTKSSSLSWHIQYSLVWSNFFRFYDENEIAHKVVLFKLRRLLYEEISQMDKFPNYKNARILGYCLNVMGLDITTRSESLLSYPLHKWILVWTKNNYSKIRNKLPDVADACLIGTISYDKKNLRLVKTYIKGLSRIAPKRYLELMPLSNTKRRKAAKKIKKTQH